MLECLIIGDSIAVGTQQFRPDCAEYAKGGISTSRWLKKYGSNDLSAEVVIISLGTNDSDQYNTYAKLVEVREKIKGKRVYWVAPNPEKRPTKRQDIYRVADKFGDTVLTTDRWQADKIHPSWTGYKQLGAQAK